jgi:hypothetical protein
MLLVSILRTRRSQTPAGSSLDPRWRLNFSIAAMTTSAKAVMGCDVRDHQIANERAAIMQET